MELEPHKHILDISPESECLELLPLSDMKSIFSELVNQGVAENSSIFKNINEDEKDFEKVLEKVANSSGPVDVENESILKDEKSMIELMIDEKSLSEIDFEISKDMFDEIKIKEENTFDGIKSEVEEIKGIDDKFLDKTKSGNIDQNTLTFSNYVEDRVPSIMVTSQNEADTNIKHSIIQEINSMSAKFSDENTFKHVGQDINEAFMQIDNNFLPNVFHNDIDMKTIKNPSYVCENVPITMTPIQGDVTLEVKTGKLVIQETDKISDEINENKYSGQIGQFINNGVPEQMKNIFYPMDIQNHIDTISTPENGIKHEDLSGCEMESTSTMSNIEDNVDLNEISDIHEKSFNTPITPTLKEVGTKIENALSEIEEAHAQDDKTSFIKSGHMKKVSSADSVQAVIESVVQASLKVRSHDSKSNTVEESDSETDAKSKEEKISMTTENGKNSTEESTVLKKPIPMKKKTYGLFEVVVPLIGKNVMPTGYDTPFTQRYDLARQRNELRAKYQRDNPPDFPIPTMSYQEWRKQRESRTPEQIEKEERDNVIAAMRLATIFTKIAIKILREYKKEVPNETAMIRYFSYFECAPASPLSLIYSPQLIHTIMLCRSDSDLSPKLRRAANECYDKCHVLFPIPEGYNFETIYTSEVKKNLPDVFDSMSDIELDYGEYDSSDFEEDIPSENEDASDEDWE